MKVNKIGILVLLMAMAMVIGPVSAATYEVDPSMSNSEIQNVINNAESGSTIYFDEGTYTDISLNINKPLTLANYPGDAVTLNGDISTSAVFNVYNTAGVAIRGFTINGSSVRDYINLNNVNNSLITNNVFNNAENYTTAIYDVSGYGNNITNNVINMFGWGYNTGIAGSYMYNTIIKGNTLLNGGDAMNIYQEYRGLTIDNNTINHMADHHGDGISIVNCGTPETTTSTSITNNKINDTLYGIFSGGYFRGTISGNTISDISTTGIDMVKKQGVGSLYANITGNNITETPTAIELGLNVPNLLLDNNILNGTSSINTITGFTYPTPHNITVTYNYLNTVSQAFIDATTIANNNMGPGAYTKP